MLKLARRARGHIVTLIEISVHLIRVKPGHIWQDRTLCTITGCGRSVARLVHISSKISLETAGE